MGLLVAGRLSDGGYSWQFAVLPLGTGGCRGLANHIGRRGAVEAEARGNLRHRLPRLVQSHHLIQQLRAEVAMNPPRWNGGGLAVDRDVGVGRRVSGKRLRSLALGLLDVLADCA